MKLKVHIHFQQRWDMNEGRELTFTDALPPLVSCRRGRVTITSHTHTYIDKMPGWQHSAYLWLP